MNIKKFAFIAEGDVFHTWNITDEQHSETIQMLLAGLASNPIVVEIKDPDLEVDFGWTFDGTNFIPPTD